MNLEEGNSTIPALNFYHLKRSYSRTNLKFLKKPMDQRISGSFYQDAGFIVSLLPASVGHTGNTDAKKSRELQRAS